MKLYHRYIIVPTFLSLITAGIPACQKAPEQERWVTTSNTNADLDWDAIGKAYKEAEGPADFERRVNEIYTGDEIISVSVVDKDDSTQVVTGFFDKNADGVVAGDEKVFEITRNITGEGEGNYQVAGHGHYAGYHSPMMGIVTGMMLGSMMAGSMRPGYAPARYVTSPAKRQAISSSRSAYRAANPSRFPAKASQTGRTYGNRGSDFNKRRPAAPARRSGGARFGLTAETRAVAARRLDA